MPYCPNCGKQVPETDNFCRGCGFDLTTEQVEQPTPEATAVKPDKPVEPPPTPQEPSAPVASGRTAPDQLSRSSVQQPGESKQQWQSRLQDTPPPTGVEHYRRLWKQFAWAWLGCWLLAIPVGIFIPSLSILVAVVGGACYIFFCYYYCKSKGQSGAWTLCAVFLGLIGLLILALLPDRNENGVAESPARESEEQLKIEQLDEEPQTHRQVVAVPPTQVTAEPHKEIKQEEPLAELDECPFCGKNSVKLVGGIQSPGEFITFFILLLLLIIPGIVYLIQVQKVPYCINCHRRVEDYWYEEEEEE